MHFDLTTRQSRVTCALCNSNWWKKLLFLADSLLVSKTFSPINLTTRQSRVTCARPKQCKSNRWKTFLFLADTLLISITFPQINRTTTPVVEHPDPLAVRRLFPCSTGFNHPTTMRWARQAGASRRFERLTHFDEVAGSARFTFIYPKKLISTSQFSSGGSGHLKRGPNHAFHPCQNHLDLAKSSVLYIKLVASAKKVRRNLFIRGQKRQQQCTSWSDQITIDANKPIQDVPALLYFSSFNDE